MKRTCPKCACAIWVMRPQMAFGMHRPILLFDHRPTIQEIDAVVWPVMSPQLRAAFMKAAKPRSRKRRGRKS